MQIHRTILLALLMAVVVMGCDKDDKKDEGKTDATKAGEQAKETPPAAPADEKAPAAKEVDVKTMKQLPTDVLTKKRNQYIEAKIGVKEGSLTDAHMEFLTKIIKAAQIMDDLFWMQASAEGPVLKAQLEASQDEATKYLYEYLLVNAGPYDRLDDFEPFLGASEKPLGAMFYPTDMTKEEFEGFIKDHPDQKKAFMDTFTVITRDGKDLKAVPYSEFYQPELAEAAKLLKEAAELTDDPALKKFLVSRADAFASNDYFQSDMDWMDTGDGTFEITIGPYEVYEDRLFGYKAAFEAFVTMTDSEQSKQLQNLANYIPEMETHLPIADEFKNTNRGTESPIKVVDIIFTAGDTKAGVQTIAFNLPNDEKVREAKGSKKVLLRNIILAKFEKILGPIANEVIAKDQQPFVQEESFFMHTLLHEISHGIGPGNITLADGTKTTVNLALKETYSAIEEAKADILGQYNRIFLIEKGVFPKDFDKRTYVTFLAGIFRSIRFGISEAHGKANMVLFNMIFEKGGYTYDAATKTYAVDFGKIAQATKDTAAEILMIEAKGDYEGAKALLAKYGAMPDHVKEKIATFENIPVDIFPQYTILEKLAK